VQTVNGQFEVPAGGQLKVPTPAGLLLAAGTSLVELGLAHPERVAVGDDDAGVVQQPVEDAYGGGVFGQEAAPLLEGPVGGHGQGASFVGGGDESEWQLGAGVIEGREADFVDDDQLGAQQGVDDLADGVVGQAAVEGFDQVDGSEVADLVAGVHGGDTQPDEDVTFAGAGSEGDRLQQLRAVLPCEVRVVAETHPLFGRLLAARSFKRWNGALLLVVELPDGSPGTIHADATDVFGGGGGDGAVSVLDAAGLRELRRLTQRLFQSRVAGGLVDSAQVGSPRP
jgi:hypothetical protein